jgi:DNA-directed RNA polymerase specialized sigma24 family protein
MPPQKSQLPREVAEPLQELSARAVSYTRRLEQELLRLALVEKYPVAAIARAAGIDEEVMKKRVARIRRRLLPVQEQEAA